MMTVKKMSTLLLICGMGLLCGLFSVRSDGAVNQNDKVNYTCKEGVWYKLLENKEMEIQTDNGAAVLAQLSVQEAELGAEEVYMFFDGRAQYIGQGRLRGGYVCSLQDTLVFAIELTDSTGQEYTNICRMGEEPDALKGRLLKEADSITVEECLCGGFVKRTQVDAAAGTYAEEIIQTALCGYTLIRPLLTAAEAGIQSGQSLGQIDAGAQVQITACEAHENEVWYFAESGDVQGWFPVEASQLVFQAAEFDEVFSQGDTFSGIRRNLNADPVVQDLYVRSANVYMRRWASDHAAPALQLCEYLPECDERMVLEAPVNSFDVGIINLTDSYFSPVIVVQYVMMIEDGYRIYDQYMCRLYRAAGTRLIPVEIDGYESGEIPIRLLAEIPTYTYSSEKITPVAGNGEIKIDGTWYRLEDFNHLVKQDT